MGWGKKGDKTKGEKKDKEGGRCGDRGVRGDQGRRGERGGRLEEKLDNGEGRKVVERGGLRDRERVGD